MESVYDVTGAFHVHSNYSFDGHASAEEIIEAAGQCGIDFFTITDHFRLDAKTDGWEGWHKGVFVIVGEEISPRHNHYLAFGIEKPVQEWHTNARPQDYIDAVAGQGGFGFVAHPDHAGSEKFKVKSYSWNDWSAKGFTGMSIWDFMTDFQEKLVSYPAALAAIISPALCFTGPKQETLKRWDDMNKTAKIFGFGELDNHKTPKKLLGFKVNVFPFHKAFATIRTHLLLKEPLSKDNNKAKNQIFGAIKTMSGYVAQEQWNNAKGFEFIIENTDGVTHIGGEARFTPNGNNLKVNLPCAGEICVVKDGVKIKHAYASRLETKVEAAGLYRIEVKQKIFGKLRPWIYSNPIWVS